MSPPISDAILKEVDARNKCDGDHCGDSYDRFSPFRLAWPSREKTAPIGSIAVLPFQNRSSDADTEYLSDGLAESLIYRLSQLPNLKVSPTSSVFRYKGKETDPIKIGNELGVKAVMSGRIVQRGDNLTISVELVDVRTGGLLWGEQYERKMSELLGTQREIATEITNKLQLKLSGEDTKSLTKRYTDNNEAYQLYLKGRYYWNKRTPENIRKAIEQFKAAADKDPSFALAYVGLADSNVILLYYTRTSVSEALRQQKPTRLVRLRLIVLWLKPMHHWELLIICRGIGLRRKRNSNGRLS